MEALKKVSLITTLYNEELSVVAFLQSYKQQTRYADEFIIVDGGSNDATVAIIEKFSQENRELNIQVIVDKTCSKKYVAGPIAKGRNVAIERAKHEYIAVSDAGCILDAFWLEEIVKPFDDASVDVVSGWYKANIQNDFQQKFSDILMPELESINRETFLPSSRSLAFKKSCWKKIGGYPTLTYTAEDTKFDLDLKKSDCKFIFAEKAFVSWDVPLTMQEARNKLFSYGYGDGELRLLLGTQFLKSFFLFFPIHILLSKQKRRDIYLSYNMFLFNKLGYFKGLINSFIGSK